MKNQQRLFLKDQDFKENVYSIIKILFMVIIFLVITYDIEPWIVDGMQENKVCGATVGESMLEKVEALIGMLLCIEIILPHS